MVIRVFAPAKVNLTLHVTGQRADGYHLLDSLVVFADVGDELLIFETENALSLTLEGPEVAGVPTDIDNLVLKAVRGMSAEKKYSITLTKNLPAASGIGGGSSDAAAILRVLMTDKDQEHLVTADDKELIPLAKSILGLGADVPMCLLSKPARIRGIGESIEFVDPLGPIPALLINPRVEVPTYKVFAALNKAENPPMPTDLPKFKGVRHCAEWLKNQRNDLQEPAISVEPKIAKVLSVLDKSENCLVARMSGSGATCFGIFPDRESLIEAGRHIYKDYPDWWMASGMLGNQFQKSLPEFS